MKNRKNIAAHLTLLALLVFSQTPLFASYISVDLTVDDAFSLYVSTDDNVLGTYVGGSNGNLWWTPSSYAFELTPDVTNYIHVVAWDVYGSPSGFVGDFTLSDDDFVFASGTQYQLTNTTDWTVSANGFGSGTTTVTAGSYPWGTIGNIDPNATWIWTSSGWDAGTRYFSTTVTSTTTSVPEPASLLLLSIGLVGILGMGWRRNRK